MNFEFTNQISQKSDQELADIYLNGKDFQPDFVARAVQEMQQRGLSLEALTEIRNARYAAIDERLAAGKPGNPIYIGLGFLVALMGGVAGIVAGFVYSQSRQPSVDGQQQYYVYDEDTRRKGRLMMGLGILVVCLVLWKNLLDG